MTPDKKLLHLIAICAGVANSATVTACGVLQPTEIRLKTAIAAPCISVEANEVRIVLPKSKVDSYASAKRNIHWTTETERWALIRGDQARDIESRISEQPNDGCFSVTLADLDKTPTRDGEYLIWHFLEKGEAMVLANGNKNPEEGIIMKSMGLKNGAEMWFQLKGQTKPFLKLTWWVI